MNEEDKNKVGYYVKEFINHGSRLEEIFFVGLNLEHKREALDWYMARCKKWAVEVYLLEQFKNPMREDEIMDEAICRTSTDEEICQILTDEFPLCLKNKIFLKAIFRFMKDTI